MQKCKNCKSWYWTHNTWGDCKNKKISKRPEQTRSISLAEIYTIPRSKKVIFATEENFGCILFKKKI